MNLVFSLLASLMLSMNLSTSVPYSAIERAFEANNAKGVVIMGKSKLLINVLGKEGAYSQSQAKLIVQDFMTKNHCTSFEFIFKGKESSDGSFVCYHFVTCTGLQHSYC